MNRIFFTCLILFAVLAGKSQVTLNKTYNFSTSVVKLESLGYKYYLMDVPNSQCRIYNMDHSLFKTINCTVPGGYYLADIKFVSEKLFNPDSQIELAYTYYQYVATTTSYYYKYGAKIVNESGTVLQTIDGAEYLYVVKTGDAENKLLAYCYDFSVSPEKVWTNIYNLPGIYTSATVLAQNTDEVLINAYPNPATDIIRLDYELPVSVKSASMSLIDNNGRTVKNYQIDGHSDHIALNVNDLPSGVYHYFVEYGNQRSSSKKIVVQ